MKNLLFIISLIACSSCNNSLASSQTQVDRGDVIDEFNGVSVYYNGIFSGTSGRNVSPDGYNIGLKYQCVEFVKRYYFYKYDHRMPNPWGHARDFYNSDLSDGELNSERGLYQHDNGGRSIPRAGDIMVFSPTVFNSYGHVAIVSSVSSNSVEIIQQNTPFSGSRQKIDFSNNRVQSSRVLGWLSSSQ